MTQSFRSVAVDSYVPAAGIVCLGLIIGPEATVSRLTREPPCRPACNLGHRARAGRDLIFHFDISREGPFLFAHELEDLSGRVKTSIKTRTQ